jgi:hypothetical protein
VGDNLSQIYRNAADYIEKHGWWRGSFFDPSDYHNGAACAAAAISRVAMRAKVSADEANEAIRLVGQHVGKTVPVWNDAPWRTKDDVIFTLRELSDKLDNTVVAKPESEKVYA